MHRFLGRGAAVLFGVAASLVAAEVALRLGTPNMVGSYQGLYTRSPDIGYKMVPGSDVVYQTPEYSTPIVANRWGFRDHDVRAPREGVQVLVLGDSITEALQVPWEATFHQRFARELILEAGTASPAGDQVAVMAVGGSSPLQEYAIWRFYGRRLRPASTLLVLCPNDFEAVHGVALPPTDTVLQEAAQARARQLTGSWIQRVVRRLHLYTVLRNALWRWRVGTAFAHEPDAMDVWTRLVAGQALSSEEEAIWRGTMELVAALAREVRGTGADFVVMMVPFQEHVDLALLQRTFALGPSAPVDVTRADRHLDAALRRQDIAYLTVAPALEAAITRGERVYFTKDRHLTARGHEVVGEALADWWRLHRMRRDGAVGGTPGV